MYLSPVNAVALIKFAEMTNYLAYYACLFANEISICTLIWLSSRIPQRIYYADSMKYEFCFVVILDEYLTV